MRGIALCCQAAAALQHALPHTPLPPYYRSQLGLELWQRSQRATHRTQSLRGTSRSLCSRQAARLLQACA